jgi:hypothetical protein
MMKRTAILIGVVLIYGAGGSMTAPSFAETISQPGHLPLTVLGRKHPGRIKGQDEEGVVVDLRDGGTQVVQFSEIWRIRRAFASDEPAGTTVIDFANNRLFVASPVAGLVSDIGKKVPLGQFTAPNGEIIYMATGKITDISKALPGLHNPASKSVIGTRDGAQQVAEPADDAKRIAAGAHTAQ